MSKFGIDSSRLNDFKKTTKEILKEIKPSSSQDISERKFVDSILNKINKIKGLHKKAIIAGSFARNTNLKDSKDFDIFVLYPTDTNKEIFVNQSLALGKEVFKGNFWEKAYSQHPYIRGIIDGYKVEVVPAYDIENTSQLISAVDRTPFHLQYLLKNLKNSQKDEVRLLKYFLKKINCYGADSEFLGFSGYLCELLVLYYKSFLGVLQAVSNWDFKTKIVLEENQELFLKNFDDPLIVIDPIDNNRNVASAVEKTTISRFIIASRSFLNNPVIDFFKSKIYRNINYHQLVGKIENIPLLILEIENKDLLKDIIWSKIRRLAKKLNIYLKEEGFQILKINFYYNDNTNKAYIFIILDNLQRSRLKLNIGPKVNDIVHCENFINNSRASFGPYIKNDYLYSLKIRSKIDIKPIVLDFLFNNFKLPTKIYVGEDIRDLYLSNLDISSYFNMFFLNKEEFLL
jgi:tRNA nucleotidyltransferase (CCA-adding enzyme)